MAESRVRRQKRETLAASWRALTPAQRLKRAAVMTGAGRKLRAAGLASRGKASIVRDAASAPFRDIGRVLAVLRGMELSHALIGGWAVIVWGYLRTSEDIDLLVDLPASRRKELIAALGEDYEAEWLAGGEDDPVPGLVRAVPRSADHFPVDLLPVRGRADRGALSRAVAVAVEGISIPVVSPEDLIAMKLEAGGGQDYADARRLLEVLKGGLDETRLEEACRERHALDRLALIRR
ncbi:MAG: nucleotidyl transferase AbiEii/AbiGii toxin family protein [Elusimicrobia bacterium]|nr:nucleotidyl transferase AbiEii/AbiGii toxin family protein [Elusimicrobiota bacterium]